MSGAEEAKARELTAVASEPCARQTVAPRPASELPGGAADDAAIWRCWLTKVTIARHADRRSAAAVAAAFRTVVVY